MASKITFVREATGLVREISTLDQILNNMNGVAALASIVFTSWWIWYAVPGGNALVACVIGFLCGIFGFLVAFAISNATFPRSAGPYVTTSRVFHPSIGWPFDMLQWFCIASGLALNPSFMITWGLEPGLYSMGVSSGNQWLINAANSLGNPWWALLCVGIPYILFSFLLAISGTRRLVRTFQLPATILSMIGVVVIAAIWATTNQAQMAAAITKYLGSDYGSVMTYANANYPSFMGPPNYALFTMLAAIGFTAGSFNTYNGSWSCGELRNANNIKTQILTLLLPSAICFVSVFAVIAIAQASVGSSILIAMTQILTNNPGFFPKAPAGWAGFYTMTMLPMIIADNTLVQFVIMVALVATVAIYFPVMWLIISRQWFAWSFDRLIPSKFAEVSDRFHTPAWSTFVNFIVVFVFIVIFTFYGQYLGFFTTASWDAGLSMIAVVCLAVAFLPLRKNLWDASPAKKYMIGAVPIATIVGLIGFFYNATAVAEFTFTPSLGFGLPSTEFLLVIFIIPFVLYWVIRQIRIKQNIDFDAIFRTIPPE
ncbi:MAG: amino acid permease [Candidatus Bathyarchaeia archaeon]